MVQPLSVVEVKTKGWEITIKEHPDPSIQEKSVTLSENGETTILPDEGFKGLSAVNVKVDVEAGVEIAAERRSIISPADVVAGQVLYSYKRFSRKNSPDVMPGGYGSSVYNALGITKDGEFILIASTVGEPTYLYKRNDEGDYENIPFSQSQVSDVHLVKFSPDKQYLILGNNLNGVYFYKRSGDTWEFLHSRIVNSGIAGATFTSDGTYVAIAYQAGDRVTIFKRNGDTFTPLPSSDFAPGIPGAAYAVAFSADDKMLAVGHANTPFCTLFTRNGDVFTKVSSVAAGAQVNGVAFTSDNKQLVMGISATPYLRVHRGSGNGTFTYAAPGIYAPAAATGLLGAVALYKGGESVFVVRRTSSEMIAVYSNIGGILREIPFPTVEYPIATSTAALAVSDTGVLVWAFGAAPYMHIAQMRDEYSVEAPNDAVVEGHAIVLTNAQQGEQVEIAYIRG